jgi:hypothetical protein
LRETIHDCICTHVARRIVGVVPHLDAAKWGLLAVTLIGIGVMLWARIDDRRKGLL